MCNISGWSELGRFAIVEGHYLYCLLHHGGQNCPLYAKMCRISAYFNPGLMWSESRVLDDENGEHTGTQIVYQELCRKNGIEPEFS